MTLNINWNNFTSQEIISMKAQGTKVPDDVYKIACQLTLMDSNDSASMNYEVKDSSGDKNEASEEFNKYEGNTYKKCETLTKTCENKLKSAEAYLDAMNKMGLYIEEQSQIIVEGNNVSSQEVENLENLLIKNQAKIDKLEKREKALQQKAENGTITEFEKSELDAIQDKLKETVSDTKTQFGYKKDLLASNLNNANEVMRSVKNTSASLSDAATAAGNFKEYGDLAINMGETVSKTGFLTGALKGLKVRSAGQNLNAKSDEIISKVNLNGLNATIFSSGVTQARKIIAQGSTVELDDSFKTKDEPSASAEKTSETDKKNSFKKLIDS